MTNRNKPFLFLATLLALVALTGCPAPAPGGGGAPDPAQIAAGKAVFGSQDCTRCLGGGRAPDLTHAGAAPAHTAAWLSAHVKNPKTHNQGSNMPAYEGKIPEKDLVTLGIYLASLK